jgi:uncharacterized protein (TIGR00369 family)
MQREIWEDVMTPKMNIEEMEAFVDEVFPQMMGSFDVLEIAPYRTKIRMNITDKDLRPGGTVSGPAMFTAVDCAFYLATLAMIGPEALTVTTNCSIDFMRKPALGHLIADARILKLGKVLSVGDVMLYSEGMDEPVAHANLTYSIPKSR